MDSGILFSLLGYADKGDDLLRRNDQAFEKALQVELGNVTLPGEREKATHLRELFEQYRTILKRAADPGALMAVRKNTYFTELLPLFGQIKGTADEILKMNQQNMTEANDRARQRATSARERMYVLLFVETIVAIGLIFFSERWILRPIKRLILSAEESSRETSTLSSGATPG
jgi:hypothetical protein